MERIAANDPTAEIAAQVDDLLKDGEENVFQTMDNEFFQADLAYSTQDIEIPRTFAQVLRLPQEEKMKWIRACQRESASHLAIPSISGVLRQDQWTKAPPVRLTWVFAKKDIYKARIVMLGQHMQEGIHFNDTHSPVPSVTCVRLVLALTAASQRKLTQMDVKTAFLNAPIDIELDVILPDGFGPGENNEQFNSFEGRRRRALTAIPGCPQGSRVWRQKIVGVLNQLGFSTFLPDEPCLFKDTHQDPIILVLWVDDIIESAPSTAASRSSDLHDRLRAHFPHEPVEDFYSGFSPKKNKSNFRLFYCRTPP